MLPKIEKLMGGHYMIVDPNEIDAEVYHHDKERNRFYIKVSFTSLGMYINSFVLQPSKYEDQPAWLQPPKHRQGFKWVGTVDFEKSSELWQVIEQKAREAALDYEQNPPMPLPTKKLDVVIEEIPDGPITLDDIPF
jgi:hypothetical protein